ncbi:PspC domain-containing protein [Streptomyces sp. NPDC019990]|uniref:PspC domain-containing protein n=1 Tax=Streptomyces sp. NPDC019990 TaxID=3154693 RepID=UPI003407D353
MTDHEHAATGPGPGSGPRPTPGPGPQDAAPAGSPAPPRAHEGADAGEEKGAPDAAGLAGEATPPGLPHRFRRDRRHKILAGVCSGLGRQCDMDPVIFRITLAVLSATGGIGLLVYGFAWLFVPYDDEDENEARKLLTGRVDGQALTAVLFALVGCGVFLTLLSNGGVLTFAVVLSFLLAGAGYWSRRRGSPSPDPLAAQAAAEAPPEPQAPPAPTAFPSWWRDPVVKHGTPLGSTGYLWGPRDYRDADTTAAINISRGIVPRDREDEPAPRTRPPEPRGPRWIGGWIFLLAVLAGSLGTRLSWDERPLGTSLQTGLACSLAVLGLGIAVSAFLGRTGAGSIFLAIMTAGLLAGAAALPKDIGTQWNRTTWRPATVADVQHRYSLGTGVGTLDLTRLDLTGRQAVTTRADVGVGRMRVLVSENVTVRLTADVGVGDLKLPGDDAKNVDVKPGWHKETTLSPAKNVRNSGTIDLDLQVGAGQVEVTRAAS